MIEPRLQYKYVGYHTDTGLCHSCITTSYVINAEGWVEVPELNDDYVGKYYNVNTSLFYLDSQFAQIWEECPSHNV